MSKVYQVTYEFKGVEVVNVFLDDTIVIPDDFQNWTLRAQDEWLYENQSYSKKQFTDTTWGNAVNILPTSNLKLVK